MSSRRHARHLHRDGRSVWREPVLGGHKERRERVGRRGARVLELVGELMQRPADVGRHAGVVLEPRQQHLGLDALLLQPAAAHLNVAAAQLLQRLEEHGLLGCHGERRSAPPRPLARRQNGWLGVLHKEALPLVVQLGVPRAALLVLRLRLVLLPCRLDPRRLRRFLRRHR